MIENKEIISLITWNPDTQIQKVLVGIQRVGLDQKYIWEMTLESMQKIIWSGKSVFAES